MTPDSAPPISTSDPSATLRRRLEAGEAYFRHRSELDESLGSACFRALAADPNREAIIDHTAERKVMKAGLLLALATALSRRWVRRFRELRVGVALPPGIGGTVANLALVLAGKTPVNLNFTAGRSAVEHALAEAGVRTIVTASALKEKMHSFPWPEATIDIRDELEALGKLNVAGWLTAIRFLPTPFLIRRLGLAQDGGSREAGLLFTSGSVAEPKGVVLSHRNIVGNSLQIRETEVLPPGQSLMACLPIFHSFGFTVTLWYALLHGVKTVCYPSPLDTRRIAEIIEQEQVDVFVGSATFLRGYLRKADRTQLRSLKCAIAGAEKLPRDLHDSFLEKFGVPILEGYGLTETTPVVSVNRRADTNPEESAQKSRVGSVGPLVNGLSARILSIDKRADLSLFETGLLALKGVNIFEGYLNDSKLTGRVLRDGWFITGDLARFDEDGFLHIEGRLSRFSKIGGEMVPHSAVEQTISRIFAQDSGEEQTVAVVGVPDTQKGEALVLITTLDIPANRMREELTAAGLPNLWMPRRTLRVERIPILATGKIDLQTCRRMAAEEG